MAKKDPLSRYRKIEVRLWADERFRALSPIPPCGQGLWLYLLTGPHTGPIPGLFTIGRAAMAEALDWDVEAFDKAFREAFAQGMVKADWKAKVIWAPNAIKYNKPESPNVVVSWAQQWSLIPECDLKVEAFKSLQASVYALGEAFTLAFDKAFCKASSKPIGKTIGNQEQEQEQEQNITPPTPQGGSVTKVSARKSNATATADQHDPEGFDDFWSHYPRKQGKANALKAWNKLKADKTLQQTILASVIAQAVTDDWRKDSGRFVPHPATWLNARRWEDVLGVVGKHHGLNGHNLLNGLNADGSL